MIKLKYYYYVDYCGFTYLIRFYGSLTAELSYKLLVLDLVYLFRSFSFDNTIATP